MSELPRGWAAATLPDLIGQDGTFSDGDWVETKDQNPSGDVRLTQLADIGDGAWRNRSRRFMTREAADRLGCTFLRPGDVLVARMPDPLGRACVFPGDSHPSVTAVDVCVVRPGSSSVDARWLMWWLNTPQIRDEVTRRQAGTTRKRISRKNLADIPLPTPPLAEQKRIVAAIDEHLSRLGSASASLANAHQLAAELGDSVLDDDAAGDWQKRPLGEMLREPLRNGHSAKADPDGTIRTLTLTAVTTRDFSNRNTKLTAADTRRVVGLWLVPGDVLVERSNTPELVGTAALYTGEPDWAIFPDLLIRVRPRPELIPEYLELTLRTRRARTYFRRAAQGIAGSMPKIDQGTLERFEVPVPPLPDQRRIVSRVAEQLSAIEGLGAALNTAQRRSDSLRRSILASAFRGELVPQDPDDEPASVLLERIAAERAEQAPPRRARRGAATRS